MRACHGSLETKEKVGAVFLQWVPEESSRIQKKKFRCSVLRELSQLRPSLRACLHGGGGPQVGEITRLGGVKK